MFYNIYSKSKYRGHLSFALAYLLSFKIRNGERCKWDTAYININTKKTMSKK